MEILWNRVTSVSILEITHENWVVIVSFPSPIIYGSLQLEFQRKKMETYFFRLKTVCSLSSLFTLLFSF